MKYIYYLFISIFFIACSTSGGSSSSTTDSNTTTNTNTNSVRVFTLAPVVNALVTDDNSQVAVYDKNSTSYIFPQDIAYPVLVKVTSNTFIDIDYDGNKSAVDLKPSSYFTNNNLKSFCSEINFITNAYSGEYNDSSAITEYKTDIQNRFNIDICNNSLDNEQNAKVLFAAYNYVIEGNSISSLSDIDSYLTSIENFYDFYLASKDVNKTKYFSFYNSLVKLDELDSTLIQRADTLHKPIISNELRGEINITDYNNSINVFDISINDNDLFIASGHDELVLLSDSLAFLQNSSPLITSFGYSLYMQNFNNNNCLFLADGMSGLKSFSALVNNFTEDSNISTYFTVADNLEANITQEAVININGYVSALENKRLLGISTKDKGFYLLNIKDIFTNCTLNKDINESDFLILEGTGLSISSEFRDDGTYLYSSMGSGGISGYKIDVLDKDIISDSLKTFTLENSAEAYNLKLINNDNELFVTTDRGVQIYDIGNSVDVLTFVSEYKTEGAQSNNYNKLDFYNNYLFLTDGYKGLKVLKLDDSYNPMLCGVEYFSPKDSPFELAKVNSVKYDSGFLYVGIDSYGIVKFKMEDILFEHCK